MPFQLMRNTFIKCCVIYINCWKQILIWSDNNNLEAAKTGPLYIAIASLEKYELIFTLLAYFLCHITVPFILFIATKLPSLPLIKIASFDKIGVSTPPTGSVQIFFDVSRSKAEIKPDWDTI